MESNTINRRRLVIFGAVLLVLLAGVGILFLVSGPGPRYGPDAKRAGPTGPTTTTTSRFESDRQALCREQERLLDSYIAAGDVKKMREYQRYLTGNRCYGSN